MLFRRGIAFLGVLAMVAVACSDADIELPTTEDPVVVDDDTEAAGGVYAVVPYGDLDLTTPEAAVAAFVDNFRSGDMITAYLVLDIDAQLAVFRAIQNLDVGELVSEPSAIRFDGPNERDDFWGATSAANDIWTLAAEGGIVPLDLTGGIEEVVVVEAGAEQATLTGVLTSTRAPVTITTTTSPSGRWRVQQILADGGDPDRLPLSAPPERAGSRPAPDLVSYFDKLPASTPTDAVTSLGEAFARDDWVAFWHLLGFDAQQLLFRGLQNVAFDIFLPPPGLEIANDAFSLDGAEHLAGELLISQTLAAVAAGDGLTTSLAIESIADVEIDDATGTAVVDATAGGAPLTIRLAEDRVGRWRITHLIGDGGDPEANFWSAAPPGFVVPAGATLCFDGIVRWDCGTSRLETELLAEDQARIDEITQMVEDGEMPAAEGAAEIVSITSARTAAIEADPLCAVMQGYELSKEITVEARTYTARVLEEICPGDPALLDG